MTVTIDPNFSENTDSFTQGNTDPASSLQEFSKNIPMCLPNAEIAGLGSTHQVTIGAVPEMQNKEDETFELIKDWIIRSSTYEGLDGVCGYILDIKDKEKRFELLKIIAAKGFCGIGEMIKNSGIEDQSMIFEILKISAAFSYYKIGKDIKSSGIKDQNMIFEILKISAASRGSEISRDVDDCGMDQKKIFEIFKIAAAKDGSGTRRFVTDSYYIQHYGFSDDQQLEILQISLGQIASEALTTGNLFSLKDFVHEAIAPRIEKPFKMFDQTCAMEIPVNFETAEAKQKVEENLIEAFNQLKDFAIQMGASAKVLTSLEAAFKKHTSLQQQQKDLLWFGAWVMQCYGLHLAKEALQRSLLCNEEMKPFLNCILNTIDPNLRSQATSALIAGYNDPQKIETLKNLMGEIKEERLHLIVLFSTVAGIEKEMTKQICAELSSRKFADAMLMAPINELMGALYESSSLSSEEKKRLLGLIFLQAPVKGKNESKPDFNVRLEQYRKSQKNSITAVHSLLCFGQEKILKNITDATSLITQWQKFMEGAFYVKADVLDKFIPTFGSSKRYPNGLITYASRLKTLPGSWHRHMPLVGKFVKAVLDETFPKIRYSFDGNKHLETIFSGKEELLKNWQLSLPIKIDGLESESFTIEDTDAWEDLLLIGTEVERSCQHILGNVGHNQSLLSPMLDGKIRPMIAREKSSGKILGRAYMRVLPDEKNNLVLHVDKLYTRKGVDEQLIRQKILEGCKQKAQSMKIALVASDKAYGGSMQRYPGKLISFGGPVPEEAVDAIGGLHTLNGVYSIPESYLLWSPPVDLTL